MTRDERARVRAAMRAPTFTFLALLAMLAGIVALGALMPGRAASWLEAGLAIGMIGTVLWFSMEMRHETPLMRFYSVLGFCWLAILLGMTMVDFVTR